MASSGDFKDKVVLITGASSGIGEGIAIYLASLSAKLTITGRDKNRLEAVATKCRSSSTAAKVLTLVADVSNEDSLKQLIEDTVGHYGQLDVLVNNAGIFQLSFIQEEQYMSLYNQIMDTNLKSVVALTRFAVPHLIRSKGNVLNVSSVASNRPGAYHSIYAMSKAAIDMFTKCLAVELGPSGVRVNAINPAATRTPIFDKVQAAGMNGERIVQAATTSFPLRRIGEPIDCAKAVAYLTSNDASFLTGVCMLVDGGSVHTQLVIE